MTTFWGLICESGRRYKQTVESQFHLTMAALDPKSQKNNKLASVFVENQGTEYLICNLNGEKNLQERIDLMFAEQEEITFFVKGEGTVHLTGYEMPEDNFGYPGEFDDEELEDEEEEPLPVTNGKRKQAEQQPAAAANNKKLKGKDAKAQVVDIDTTKLEKKAEPKKPQQQNNKQVAAAKKPAQPADDDEDDDDLGDIDSDIDSEELDKLINQGSDDDLEEDDDFDDEDDEDDLDDDDSEDEKLKSVQQKVKGKLNGQAAGKQAQPTPNKPQQQKNQNAQTPKNNQQNNQAKTPQNNQGKTPQNNQGKTPNQGKNNNNQQNNQNRQQTPFVKNNNNKPQNNNSNKKENEASSKPETKPAEQAKTPSTKKLPNGLVIQDIAEGSGPEAKKGKFLKMNYVGRLTNNRIFDQTKNKPFAFRLGMGEVIKGWDQGIQGMKVGGKRRLTIPASLAYGKSGVGDIPPNATLVFDVELKGVN